MSYRIIFKGQVEDEFVDESTGRSLSDDWESGRIASKVKINGNLYESSSIKAVISGFNNPDHTDHKDRMGKMISDIKYEHARGVEAILKLSPEARAKRTGLAEILYTSLAHAPMPQDVKEKVIARQETFFKENPDWAFAKATCYRDLMPKGIQREDGHIANTTVASGMHLFERIAQQGIK